jgi:hypothetical protein
LLSRGDKIRTTKGIRRATGEWRAACHQTK